MSQHLAIAHKALTGKNLEGPDSAHISLERTKIKDI